CACNYVPCAFYALVWTSTAMSAFISKPASINKVIYLDPIVIVFVVNPVFHLYHCFSILLEIIYHSLKSNPSNLDGTDSCLCLCERIDTRMPLFFRKSCMSI